jgi:hypothetical protein
LIAPFLNCENVRLVRNFRLFSHYASLLLAPEDRGDI